MIVSKIKRQWVLPTVAFLLGIGLFIDSQTPLGIADYILYFIPVALTTYQHRSSLPILTALVTSCLLVVGFLLSPSGDESIFPLINRSFATVSIWVVAFLVRKIILARNEEEKNNWVKSGLNTLAEKSRGELSLQTLSSEVLTFLTSYTESSIGTLFAVNDSQSELRFVTGHSYSGDLNQVSASIKMGEGFVGQSAKDKKLITLSPVPNGYLKIASSFGSAQPAAIIILPLIADDKTIGVIELGFMKEVSDSVRDFLEQMSEPTAIALKSSRHKEKLTELLYQSQQLSAELQAQQEELRVANEELEQQSRTLKESYTKLENQQAELEQTNQQLEEQAQTLEAQSSLLNERNRDLMQIKLSLEEKALELQKSSQYKSEFLANMSHELRTPLNSSLILAKLLSENKAGNLTEEQIKYADIIYTSGNDLLNLINDILDLSKVEAGKMTIMPEKVQVSRIAENLKLLFGHVAKNKNVDFEIAIDESAPKEIITDRLRLDQILKNFLSNAFKFTQKGSVTLKIYLDAGEISFSVTDTGIGISDEQQQVIFEAFRQADGTTNRKYGGTGLGLSISKELARILGGKISVQSTQGKGSTFKLHLPLSVKSNEVGLENGDIIRKDLPPPPTVNAKVKVSKTEPGPLVQFSFQDDRERISSFSRKILIIEDDESFAKILYDLAHEMNFGALVAPTADEGIHLAKTFSPHAIALDIRLPDHSGLVVLDQLKSNTKTRHIPVHVISSSDFSKSVLEMGAIGYMLKPVKREQLLEAFNNLSEVMSQKMKHVLVIEDDQVQKEHIIRLISDSQVEVDAVETAAQALEKLSSKTYDCLIMDLSLPDLSGPELLSKLANETSTYSYPPVIVYTARDLTQEEEEQLRQYSQSIIIKGAKSPERLLSEVTLFLHRIETELPPERQKMLKDLRSRERSLEDRKILVVDDDVRNIFSLTSALENYGAKVEVARNGREALDKLHALPKVDLVLMDIMMPEMDGYEAMTLARKEKRFSKLPIIALTAKAMRDDQEKCLAAGANDYLPKPLDLDKLLSLIRVWLPEVRGFIN